MKESNYKNLRAALDQLPEYEAPTAVWTELELALDTDTMLATDIPQLPVYSPPADIWLQIEAGLAAAPQKRPNQGRTIQIAAIWRYSAAAVLALLLAAWWFWPTAGALPTGGAAVAVTQEVVDNQLLATNREVEDDAFDLIQELCLDPLPVCEQPAFKSLKTELDELTEAKTALKEALGNFGDDPELHAQLARIERERSDLLRQLVSMI